MTTTSIQPANVYALVVGIEKYQAGDDFDLNGPAHDALKFANWLLDQGVEPKNINLFLSPLDKNKDVLVTARHRELMTEAATRDKLDNFIRSQLINGNKRGDLLYIFWGGHGIITKTDSTTRRLFFADTDSPNQWNLNLDSLLEALKTFAYGSGFSQQIFFIDACANTYFQGLYQTIQGEGAGVEFATAGENFKAQQFALFASAEYEVATNESEVGTGSFSKAVLEELKGQSLLPKFKVLAERIQTNFRDKQKLEPVYWESLVGGNKQVIDNRNQGISAIPQNLPRNNVDQFVGRQTELVTLHEMLEQSGRLNIVVIKGEEGVGKSELVLQYAYRHLDQGTYPGGLCWLDCNKDLRKQVLQFAEAYLKLEIPVGDLETQVSRIWEQWPAGEVLLIFDDSINFSLVEPLLPPLGLARFRVLITTSRSIQSPPNFEVALLELKNLGEDNALQLLKAFIGVDPVQSDVEKARELCRVLNYSPKLISRAAKYIHESKRSISEAIEIYAFEKWLPKVVLAVFAICCLSVLLAYDVHSIIWNNLYRSSTIPMFICSKSYKLPAAIVEILRCLLIFMYGFSLISGDVPLKSDPAIV